MNQRTAPLPEILAVLESVTSALRASDAQRSGILQDRALELLRGRPVDCCERMILGKVLGRIARLVGGSSFVQLLETRLVAA